VSAIAAWLRTPIWARAAEVAPLGTVVPILGLAIDPVPALLMRMAVVITLIAAVDRITAGWARRRIVGAVVLLVFGFLAAGAPQGAGVAGWLAAGVLLGSALLLAYVTLLRADLTMMPLALGTAAAAGALMSGASPAFAGALPGSILGAVLAAIVGWWWFRALRRSRGKIAEGDHTGVSVTS
jgi:hypothetical protein